MATPIGNSIPITGNPQIDGLEQGGSWLLDGTRVITYSFSINTAPSDPLWGSYPGLKAAFAAAATAWSNVANISLVEAGSGTDVRHSTADIGAVIEYTPGSGVTGIGIFPDPALADSTFLPEIGETRATFPHPEGDIQLNVGYTEVSNFTSPGGYGFLVALHELGHALGLKHPDDDGGNARPTFAALGIAGLDSTSYTVMSYNGFQEGAQGNAATPMLLDILAIQSIYGANMTYHTGDDTYALSNVGIVQTIWDAGGTDTFDASGISVPVTLDLREGHFSTHGSGTTAIAYGVLIENAIGGSGPDTIIGNPANNVLSGGGGNDSLDGGTGADTMIGGTGNDTYYVDNPGDVIIEAAAGGQDVVVSAIASYVLSSNVEELNLAGSGNSSGTGNASSNTIRGNSGDNVLDGGVGGFDRLEGGAGNDTYVVHAGDTLPGTFLLIEGQLGDYVSGGGTYYMDANIAQSFSINPALLVDRTFDGTPDTITLNLGGIGADGTSLDWTLRFSTAKTGAPFGTGVYTNADRMGFESSGNPGLDIFGLGRGSNSVTGSFTVTDFTYSGTTLLSLAVEFEQHTDGNVPALTGTLHYNEPASTDPSLVIVELPGGGTDTVLSGISYTLSENVENLTLTGSGNIDGTGNALDNILLGNAGDNVLTGGLGNDTYGVDNAGDVVVENPGQGTDTVQSTITYALSANVENLTLMGSGNIDGTGNAEDNVLLGNVGVNVLTGGQGNDTYGVDNIGDTVVENPGEGTDTVRSSVDYTLTANVENLTLTGNANLSGTGNAMDNIIAGNAGDNVLMGGGGNDTLLGGSGSDTAMLSQAMSNYTLHYAAGKLVLTSATDTTTIGTTETLHYGDGQEQSVASYYLESARDANGDGRADIYWRNVDGTVALWEMNGFAISDGQSVGTAPTSWNIVGTGDLNGDGKADLVWRNSDGQVAGWLMDGANVLAGDSLVTGTVPTEWKIAGTADFNGDSKSDLLWRNDSGTVAIWLMDGLTPLTGVSLGDVPTEWNIAGTGDFNGDGNGDILWRNTDGLVALWLMKGTSVLHGDAVSNVPLEWKIAGTGDFNADGKSDILWRNDQGLTAIWEMNGFNVIAADAVATAPNDWHIAGTGDYNGDQHTDILWRNDNGQVAEWHMNGLHAQSADAVGGPVPHDWLIS